MIIETKTRLGKITPYGGGSRLPLLLCVDLLKIPVKQPIAGVQAEPCAQGRLNVNLKIVFYQLFL
jgi:hypothetical protein